MEGTFAKLRNELNEFGYIETLKPECVPLVSRLLADLKTTTESLQKYMKISQNAIEERDNLRLGAEPYKCDNAKLIRECNELHLAFIQFKEQHEKVQKDLRVKVVSLENQLQNCESEKQCFERKIKDLELQLSKAEKKGVTVKTGRPEKGKGFHLDTAMACAEEKIGRLTNEIRKLKEDHIQLAESNAFFKTQLQNRNEEIVRLKTMLEGGRPDEAINNDCCYKNIDNKMGSLQDEINMLKREKNSLHNQLKEALAKQHEAMRRALHLAERNKQLEREMKDIDQIALAVEAECNSTVRNNVEKVTRLQDRINESVIMIQNLERENSKLKQDKVELCSELDAIKLEKKNLQSLLETEVEDKKRLTNRINSFTIIEHDLNMEIDRLVRLSGEQRKKIAELECQITEGKVKYSSYDTQRCFMPIDQADYDYGVQAENFAQTEDADRSKSPTKGKKGNKSKGKHKSTCKKSTTSKPTSEIRVTSSSEKSPPLVGSFGGQMGRRCCCEAGSCVKQLRELLDKEMEYRQAQAMQQIESLKEEKEYYMKEYHRICEEMRNIPTQDRPDKQHMDLLRKIDERDRMIATLQEEIKKLTKEKNSMMSLRNSRDDSDGELDAVCSRTTCKRRSRELEMLKKNLKVVEGENETLKKKIQELNESTVVDQEKMKKAFKEMEEHIRKLEDERRDLVMNQGTHRSSMTQMEEECRCLKDKLRTTQDELNNQRASYTQLKNLHEQTDRALSESQTHLLRAEAELTDLQSRMNVSHRESAAYEREMSQMQGDIQVMKSQLNRMDKEKDDLLNILDEKTEKIAMLEDQLKDKRGAVTSLEMELRELKRKVGKLVNESESREQLLRSSEQELAMTQKDYETEKRLKECAMNENRRLQDDLASVSCECMEAKKTLDLTKRQVEDLKRQLQHYVAEVKRTEDLITQKELERAEILDQFRCLSEEAHLLENSNHTLESEATQSRVQLSVALDHASDLERKVENQQAIIKSYEKQISELTSQVASMEMQLKQCEAQQDMAHTELKQMKDLCVRLDHEKDNLKKDISSHKDERGQVTRSIDRISRENTDLKRSLEKERNNLEGLEKLLNEARQEVIEQRLLNQDLQSEMTKLKAKLEEQQERLTLTSEQLDLYQEKALDYSQQNKQLRREIANERFFRARDDDSKRYPSLNILNRSQCPRANYTPVHERSFSFCKKEKGMQSPRRYTCLGRDPKFSPRPKGTCYKYCNKDKCPKALAELQKSYYDHCPKEDCLLHPKKDAIETEVKCPDKTGVCKTVIPILKKSDECKISINTFGEYKYCSCGKPGIYCICVQNKSQPPPANSKFVATYTHTFTTVKEKATSCSDIQRRKLDALRCLPCAPSLHKLPSPKKSNKSEDVKMLMKSPRDMQSSSTDSVEAPKKSTRENSPQRYSPRCRPCPKSPPACNL